MYNARAPRTAFINTDIFLIYGRLTKIHRVLCCLCAHVDVYLFSCCILKLGVTVCLLQVSPLTINVTPSCELKPKRPKVIKTEDDATPLPYPFPLPKYYRSDVEIALKNGKITKETTSSFSCCFSCVGVQAVPNKRGLHLEQLM